MHTVYSERHQLHATDGILLEGRPFVFHEVPARAEAIRQAVVAGGLGPAIEPTDHGMAPLLAVHTADYVSFLQHAHAANAVRTGDPGPAFAWTFAARHSIRRPQSLRGLMGYYAFDFGTPILAGTWEAAYWSAQCALSAADRVLAGELTAYALCRPPGHHAAADLYGGYCYLNNAAVVARYLQRSGELRVAILDVDFHHGNGSQLIFYRDPSVLYASLHVHPDDGYPYFWGGETERGEGAGEGTNWNWPLPRGTEDEAYLAALDEALAVVESFAPDTLVVSVGLDIAEGDPEGGFRITAAGLGEIGRRIAGLGLPAVIVQEGGYRLDRLGENAVAFLRPFAGQSQGLSLRPFVKHS